MNPTPDRLILAGARLFDGSGFEPGVERAVVVGRGRVGALIPPGRGPAAPPPPP